MRVLVLGAGFGGLELTTRLSEEHGDDVEIVLIDQSDAFVFGFSKFDVIFGRATPEHVRHRYEEIVSPGVRFVQSTIRSIDPVAKRVETDAGPFEGDVMVVALGADLVPAATPGLVDGGNEFYTVEGAERDRCWKIATSVWPNYDEYVKRTTRVIPVVVLERSGP